MVLMAVVDKRGKQLISRGRRERELTWGRRDDQQSILSRISLKSSRSGSGR